MNRAPAATPPPGCLSLYGFPADAEGQPRRERIASERERDAALDIRESAIAEIARGAAG